MIRLNDLNVNNYENYKELYTLEQNLLFKISKINQRLDEHEDLNSKS